ncbi:hypothetical protein HUJ05_002779 [Dendroctonus ponderosae]|nr:hypothetical protein HUJ05_002779 [Dendroctonus ponderosae]
MNLHGKGFCEQPPRSVSDVFAQKNGSNILDSYADQRISINSTKVRDISYLGRILRGC